MTKYPLSQNLPVDFATVSAFVEEFVKGDLKPSVKSQPIPTTQDESVYVMTADSWDDVVAEKDKDLFGKLLLSSFPAFDSFLHQLTCATIPIL